MGGEGLRGGCGGAPRAIGVMWVGFPGSGIQVHYQSHLVLVDAKSRVPSLLQCGCFFINIQGRTLVCPCLDNTCGGKCWLNF